MIAEPKAGLPARNALIAHFGKTSRLRTGPGNSADCLDQVRDGTISVHLDWSVTYQREIIVRET
jgi:hypothetical protein